MDYEKKYKEALAHAKQAYGTGAYDDATLEAIFPELRESEDDPVEFLKGQAIEWIASLEHDISQSIYDGVKGHSPEDERELARWKKALSWLEKQKEQKPEGVYVDCTEHPEWYGMPPKERESTECSEDEKIRKALINHFKSHSSLVGENWNGIDCDDIIAYLEKQKESLHIPETCKENSNSFTHVPKSEKTSTRKEQKPNFSEKDSTDFEIEVHEIIAQARNDSRLNDADVLKQFEEEAAFALMLKANKLIEQKPVDIDFRFTTPAWNNGA